MSGSSSLLRYREGIFRHCYRKINNISGIMLPDFIEMPDGDFWMLDAGFNS
jgi:hypothetical protein